MHFVTSSRHAQPDDGANVAGLLAAASQGDEEAWRRVIERYGRRVYALARSRCRHAELAEEVTQSVFATIATKLGAGEYAERGRFESWLFRVAMNRIRDEMRRLARHAAPTDPLVFGAVVGSSAPTDDREGLPDLARLRMAMDQLNDDDREVVELRHHGGMSFKQMAEVLDEPLGTLLARHHRALRKLKQLMLGPAVPSESRVER